MNLVNMPSCTIVMPLSPNTTSFPCVRHLVCDCIEAYAPGFKGSVVGRDILTPPDLERVFGLPGGVSTGLGSLVTLSLYPDSLAGPRGFILSLPTQPSAGREDRGRDHSREGTETPSDLGSEGGVRRGSIC